MFLILVGYQIEEISNRLSNRNSLDCPFQTPKKGRDAGKKHTAIQYTPCNFNHQSLPTNMYPWIKTKSYKIEKINGNSIVILHIVNKT